jgi:hypothetical protein
MSLIATILFNIPNETQSLTYTLEGVQIDQIGYSKNQLQFSQIPAFKLDKADTLIYISSLNLFVNNLSANFPTVQNSRGNPIPFSQFNIVNEYQTDYMIRYGQTTVEGSQVYNITYLPTASTAKFAARKGLTISLQEFFVGITFLTLYSNQVSLN